jgi:hypothetical protein
LRSLNGDVAIIWSVFLSIYETGCRFADILRLTVIRSIPNAVKLDAISFALGGLVL